MTCRLGRMISALLLATSLFNEPVVAIKPHRLLFEDNYHTQMSAADFKTVYHRVWEIVRDNHYNRLNLSDWAKWEHHFDEQLDSRIALEKALTKLLGTLNDDYTFLANSAQQAERESQIHSNHAVDSNVLDGSIGYLRLSNLYSDTLTEQVHTKLNEMPDVNGMILDLRGNHGGFVELARSLFEILADRGKFTSYTGYQDGRSEDVDMTLTDGTWEITKNGTTELEKRLYKPTTNKPLVILVDRDTRSAAEMLAGALKQNHLATIIGQRTYGKGVLQDTYDLGDGLMLKVSTAQYFLPDGESIHRTGINPDLIVRNPSSQDRQLSEAIAYLRNNRFQISAR